MIALFLAAALAAAETIEETTVSLSGTVTAVDGGPAADVPVYLVTVIRTKAVVAETTTDARGDYAFADAPLPYVQATTDGGVSLGSFVVVAVPPEGAVAWSQEHRYHPDDTADGVNWAFPTIHHWPDSVIDIDLQLEPAVAVRGRLRNDRGEPLAGAVVRVKHADRNLDPEMERRYSDADLPLAALYAEEPPFPRLRSTTTDAEGRFTIGRFPERTRLWIEVSPDGYPERTFSVLNVPGEPTTGEGGWQRFHEFADVELPTPTPVLYRVVFGDTGKPAGPVVVSASSAGGSVRRWTDATGEVRLPTVPGDVRITASAPHGTPYMRAIEEAFLDPDAGVAGPITVRLPRAAELRITAKAADGRPAAGLWVWREVLDAPVEGWRREPAVHSYSTYEPGVVHANRRATGEDGRATQFFHAGRYRVGLAPSERHSGHLPAGSPTAEVDLKAGEITEISLTIP